jgi:hypothetical protein
VLEPDNIWHCPAVRTIIVVFVSLLFLAPKGTSMKYFMEKRLQLSVILARKGKPILLSFNGLEPAKKKVRNKSLVVSVDRSHDAFSLSTGLLRIDRNHQPIHQGIGA